MNTIEAVAHAREIQKKLDRQEQWRKRKGEKKMSGSISLPKLKVNHETNIQQSYEDNKNYSDNDSLSDSGSDKKMRELDIKKFDGVNEGARESLAEISKSMRMNRAQSHVNIHEPLLKLPMLHSRQRSE